MINQTPNQMTPTLKFTYSAIAVVCIVAMLGMTCKAQSNPVKHYFKYADTVTIRNDKVIIVVGKHRYIYKLSDNWHVDHVNVLNQY